MSKTEKRPKLLRDWPSPYRGTIPAGVIGRRTRITDNWTFFGDSDERDRQTVTAPHLRPDWFSWVDVCLTCEREVCDYDHAPEIAGKGCQLCHGHAEPKPEPPYPMPEDGSGYFISWDGVVIDGGYHADPSPVRGGIPRRVKLWRTREHAEVAAKAHRKLDEVLQNAFNVAAAGGRNGLLGPGWSEADLFDIIHDGEQRGK